MTRESDREDQAPALLRHRGEHPECRRMSPRLRRALLRAARRDAREFACRLATAHRLSHGMRRARARDGMSAFDACRLRAVAARGARASAEGRRNRPALRLSDHELDGGHVDRRHRPHRLRPDRDAPDDAGSRRGAELSRVADREPLQPARKHHRRAPRRADVLVLRHDLHLHPRRQLGRAASRESAPSAGATRRRTASPSISRSSAAPTPIST